LQEGPLRVRAAPQTFLVPEHRGRAHRRCDTERQRSPGESRGDWMNQRPSAPSRADSGIYVSRSVRRFLCVQGRGRSGQIGRCIRHQAVLRRGLTIGHALSGEPSTTESCLYARATAPPQRREECRFAWKPALRAETLRRRCRRRAWRCQARVPIRPAQR